MFLITFLLIPLVTWLAAGWVYLYRWERSNWWPNDPPLPVQPTMVEYVYAMIGTLILAPMIEMSADIWKILCLYLGGCCAALADWRYQLLPFRISLFLGLCGLGVAYGESCLVESICSCFIVGSILGIIFALSVDGMGLGDVFLAMGLATWLSPLLGAWMLVLAAVLGLIYAALWRVNGETKIPFGPFLILATWSVWCVQRGGCP